MTMNSFASTLSRDVTCGAAAALITFVLSLSFVASTSAAPFHATRAVAAEQAQRA
jgi:predicted nucleotidyltransferase